jgi:predicted RNA-binding Zn ribbon-like protein
MVMQFKEAEAEPQPGERRPAPGALATVQSFVNSRWDLSRDLEERFGSPDDLARWLQERKLLEASATLDQADLERALQVREGLRALLFANNDCPADQKAIEALNRALGSLSLGVDFQASGGPGLTPRGRHLDGALASLATIVAVARIDGRWRRLKACPGLHCGWAFYDHSRNQSGSWCSMSTCGQRTKAREYRRRRKRTQSASAR